MRHPGRKIAHGGQFFPPPHLGLKPPVLFQHLAGHAFGGLHAPAVLRTVLKVLDGQYGRDGSHDGKQGVEQRGTRVLPLHVLQGPGILTNEHEQRRRGDHHAHAAAHVTGLGVHQLQTALLEKRQ